MDLTLSPRPLRGDVTVIPSKSQAHRLLICSAFANSSTDLVCEETNRDIEATAACLNALGAEIRRTDHGYAVTPIQVIPQSAVLPCGESGSTLRFLLPIVGALGVNTLFEMSGRLPERPLSPLWEEMERMGCCLTRPSRDTLQCTGKLRPGPYYIDGGISSQYISGLLFALPLIGNSHLTVTGIIQSRPYIELTRQAIAKFPDRRSPGRLTVEGDWSNGAFWIAAQYLGSPVTVHGLEPDSAQGDREILTILPQLQAGSPTVSAADIPDLIPILSIAAAAQNGAIFTDIQRLRLKESDRVAAVVSMIQALGGNACATNDRLTVQGTGLRGGTVNAFNDHRIAMAAGIAATVCTAPVRIIGAEAVSKSYPRFWEEYQLLGGKYEFNIR